MCSYIQARSAPVHPLVSTSCVNVSGEMVQKREKEPLETEEVVKDVFTHKADKRSVHERQPDSLGVHPRDFRDFFVLCFLKAASDWSLVKNLSLFVLFTALVISWLNLKMRTQPTERPADKSIDPTPA